MCSNKKFETAQPCDIMVFRGGFPTDFSLFCKAPKRAEKNT